MTLIFFGSFKHYSAQVLEKLVKNFSISAVITTPPKPKGRHMELAKTEVQICSEMKNVPVFTLESLDEIPADLDQPDFIIVAGYGKLIPNNWLAFPKLMAVNMHASFLPHYRGAFPAEWAILRGEKETGITLVKMSPEFDKGEILVQKKIPIEPDDTHETLYTKLYDLAGELLVEDLSKIAAGKITPKPQPPGTYFYARKITRNDGFIPWEEFNKFSETVERKFRAFCGWPGVWTLVNPTNPTNAINPTNKLKRLKLISLKPEIIVQVEGKKPVFFEQFTKSYLAS